MNDPLSGLEFGDTAWIVTAVYLTLAAAGLLINVLLLVHYYKHPPRWEENAQRLRQRAAPSAFLARLVVFLAALLVIILSVHRIAGALAGPAIADNEALWVLVQSLGFHWMGLLFIAVLLHQFGATWKGVFGFQSRGFHKFLGAGLVFYLASMPFLWFYTLIYQAALRHFGYEPTWQDIALVLTDAQPLWLRIYFFFMGIVLAPFFEEVLFRGILLPYFAQKWGVSRAILLVSALFAAIHFHIPSVAALFVISVAFCLAYLFSRSLLVPIVMHGLFNAINLALMFLLR